MEDLVKESKNGMQDLTFLYATLFSLKTILLLLNPFIDLYQFGI